MFWDPCIKHKGVWISIYSVYEKKIIYKINRPRGFDCDFQKWFRVVVVEISSKRSKWIECWRWI
jgi:hypothetical protein